MSKNTQSGVNDVLMLYYKLGTTVTYCFNAAIVEFQC